MCSFALARKREIPRHINYFPLLTPVVSWAHIFHQANGTLILKVPGNFCRGKSGDVKEAKCFMLILLGRKQRPSEVRQWWDRQDCCEGSPTGALCLVRCDRSVLRAKRQHVQRQPMSPARPAAVPRTQGPEMLAVRRTPECRWHFSVDRLVTGHLN